jgi:hypothetical protein
MNAETNQKFREMKQSTVGQHAAASILANLTVPLPAAPEFSVITCSPPQNDEKFRQMSGCYQMGLAGESYEIIRISDAKSMAEGYTRGIAQARGRIIILSHDDAAPLRPIGAKLRAHLRRCDIVGGAGTDRLVGPTWFSAGYPHVFGQVLNRIFGTTPDGQPGSSLLLSVYSVPSPLVERCQAIDGFWMACSRRVADTVPFDADTCDGFHCYDIDWSFSAYLMGMNVAVATDLSLSHASTGGYGDPKWKPAADKLVEKHREHLTAGPTRGFQFAAVQGNNVDEMLMVMDGLVARSIK